MDGKKFLPLVLVLSLAVVVFSTAHAQSLPWVEVWVAVRDGQTGAVIADAQVEIPQCATLPADSCTRYGVWDGTRQVYLLKVPRLEAYEVVVSRSGYAAEVRSGTAVDPVTTWEVRLYPASAPLRPRVFLPLILQAGARPRRCTTRRRRWHG